MTGTEDIIRVQRLEIDFLRNEVDRLTVCCNKYEAFISRNDINENKYKLKENE